MSGVIDLSIQAWNGLIQNYSSETDDKGYIDAEILMMSTLLTEIGETPTTERRDFYGLMIDYYGTETKIGNLIDDEMLYYKSICTQLGETAPSNRIDLKIFTLQAIIDNSYNILFSNGYYGELDGTGDYFSMESTVTLTGEFSIAFWNKIKTAASHNYTLNDSVGNCFIDNVQLAQLVLRFGGTDKYLSYDSARTLNVWDSIIITRDASNVIKVYIDNVLQADTETQAGNFSFTEIGKRTTTYSHNDTDELAIYDYELTTADRALIVGSGTPETCGDAGATSTAPIQFWRFENNGDNEITSNTLTKEADAAYTAY
jgi:hypothetical protein